MALGSNHVTNTSAATFIPEIWSDEIIAAYQKSLKMAPLVKKMSMTGKKGDTIHVPQPLRGNATAKTAEQQVNLITNVEEELVINVNRHFEYSRLIEDITEVQALSSLRQFYTQDAGYALATRVDSDLHTAVTGFGDGTRTYTPVDTSYVNSATFYNNGGLATPYAVDTVEDSDVFTDAFLRAMIQKLDDNNVPMDGRCLVIPPSARKQIMGIDRYVSTDFVNAKGVESGLIGNLYGIDVYVSSNCGVIETAADNASASSATDVRAAVLMHRDAIVMAEQMGVRTQTQYKQEYLSNLFTADTLYGVETYRPEAGFVLAMPDA
jgi:N4-gp56 family major capsid protein